MFCPSKIYIRYIHTKTWIKPQGYDTGIKIFNCITKEKVPLISKQKGIITWYTCGPTVYDEAHIGHASCYLKIDIIQRILREYFNYNVITAMNITDIDDKIIKRSKELNESISAVSKLYETEFWSDLTRFKIKKPGSILRVSENMNCIQEFINNLIEKNIAYSTEDGSIYFKRKNMPNYGKLVNFKVEEDDVSNMTVDFALWKSSKPSEPFWSSLWGNGRPGWHVECSAMASKLFGSSLDIHAGGMDLKFPHHENEEAQSCAYHSCPQWVQYWLHIGQLYSKSSHKMSKSLKNTISIKSLLQQNKPDEFRIACLMSHYRTRMEYSPELLKMAGSTLKKYRNFLSNCDIYILKNIEPVSDGGCLKYLLLESGELIHQALCDDFNTPEVINIVNKLIKTTNPKLHSNELSTSTVIGLRNLISQLLHLFNIAEVEEEICVQNSNDNEILNVLTEFRQKIREVGLMTKNETVLRLCDDVRSFLKSKGIEIKDLNKSKMSS